MEGALLHVFQEIVLLVRGMRGVPAATSAGLVEHREGQDHRFLLLIAVEVVRTLSETIGLATGTIVRMGEHPTAAGVLVDRVIRGHVVKEVRKITVERLRMTVVGYCCSGFPGCHYLKFARYHLIIALFFLLQMLFTARLNKIKGKK